MIETFQRLGIKAEQGEPLYGSSLDVDVANRGQQTLCTVSDLVPTVRGARAGARSAGRKWFSSGRGWQCLACMSPAR